MKQTYKKTSFAFDLISDDYDVTYGPKGNAIMSWMRRENLKVLKQVFPKGSRLLELGCGSGEEAVALALAERKVLATDISPRMARITKAKAVAHNVGDSVRVVTLPAGHIDTLNPPAPFDGAYASFGGLNCEPDLHAVSVGLARLLTPGALFVTSVMGTTCLFEIIWYMLHGKPRTAFRRLRRGWQLAPVAGGAGVEVLVPTRYLSTRDVVRAFGGFFSVVQSFALPLFLPPPYADNLFRRQRTFFNHIELWDRRLRERWPWKALGDHVVVILRRN